jgi:hypothetical protein
VTNSKPISGSNIAKQRAAEGVGAAEHWLRQHAEGQVADFCDFLERWSDYLSRLSLPSCWRWPVVLFCTTASRQTHL